jgi:hypothetical protein
LHGLDSIGKMTPHLPPRATRWVTILSMEEIVRLRSMYE